MTEIDRKTVKVDNLRYMVGTYGPNTPEKPIHEFTCHPEKAPQGMIAMGIYTAKSKLVDEDKRKHLEWQWSFEIKEHWPDEKK